MKRWWDWNWLGETSRPYFGQLTLWVLLLCAQPLNVYFQINCSRTSALPTEAGSPQRLRELGERTGPSTVLSFLPNSVLLERHVLHVCGVLFVVGSILWLLQWFVPWSGWLTSLSFTAVVALYVENMTQVTHVAHVANMMLLLHALWYQCYHREIRAALRERRFWTSKLYPRWVHALGVLYLGLFYGLSGLMKLLTSGPGWANGVSLQLWTRLWGDKNSPFTALILEHRWIAVALQYSTLIGETGGLLAIVSRLARPIIGLLLIGFHIGAISVFSWGFHANVAMLILFFFPCDRWIDALASRWEKRSSPTATTSNPD
jgi:Vitamin K-dependent gamma-carboxylase